MVKIIFSYVEDSRLNDDSMGIYIGNNMNTVTRVLDNEEEVIKLKSNIKSLEPLFFTYTNDVDMKEIIKMKIKELYGEEPTFLEETKFEDVTNVYPKNIEGNYYYPYQRGNPSLDNCKGLVPVTESKLGGYACPFDYYYLGELMLTSNNNAVITYKQQLETMKSNGHFSLRTYDYTDFDVCLLQEICDNFDIQFLEKTVRRIHFQTNVDFGIPSDVWLKQSLSRIKNGFLPRFNLGGTWMQKDIDKRKLWYAALRSYIDVVNSEGTKYSIKDVIVFNDLSVGVPVVSLKDVIKFNSRIEEWIKRRVTILTYDTYLIAVTSRWLIQKSYPDLVPLVIENSVIIDEENFNSPKPTTVQTKMINKEINPPEPLGDMQSSINVVLYPQTLQGLFSETTFVGYYDEYPQYDIIVPLGSELIVSDSMQKNECGQVSIGYDGDDLVELWQSGHFSSLWARERNLMGKSSLGLR